MRVRKIININPYNYKDTEQKLEKLASKGLMFEKTGVMCWVFKKEQPKNLKFTVLCYPEGNYYNSNIPLSEQVLIDNAQAKGWRLVKAIGQMIIFSSEEENPQPIESDKERFENINRCMKKNVIFQYLIPLLAIIFNLLIYTNQMKKDFINFISSPSNIGVFVSICIFIIIVVVELVNYFIWYIRFKKLGFYSSKSYKLYNRFMGFVLVLLVTNVLLSLFYLKLEIVIFSLIGIVIVIWLNRLIADLLKKKKLEASTTKFISIVALVFLYGIYVVAIVTSITNTSNFTKSKFRTVTWQLPDGQTRETKIYIDSIPLKLEDLYDSISYDNYSYGADEQSTIFMKKTTYYQRGLPEDKVPELLYTVLEPKFDFIYKLVKEDVLKIPEYMKDESLVKLDNNIFNTIDAYEYVLDNKKLYSYILFYEDKIITIKLEKEPTESQRMTIFNKLG